MSIYAVSLDNPDKDAWDRLKAKWPKPYHVIVNNQFAFVAPTRDVTTEDVSYVVGMNDDLRVSGIVAKVSYNAINGWSRQAVWEWLEENQ